MAKQEIVLRHPTLFDNFIEYLDAADLSNEELGKIFRLAMQKELSQIKHKSLHNLFIALALHRGLEIWRTNDFYVKQANDELLETLIWLGKNEAS